MTILVDTNVLLDVITDDPNWYQWSVGRLNDLALNDMLVINDVIYAELVDGFGRFEELEALVDGMDLTLRPLPRAALFLAGKAHARYRRAGGTRAGVLPDFLIGAQAAIEGLPLLTRDVVRYRSYFPTVELLTP